MDNVKSRIPSKRETILLFVACVFSIHVWAIVVFLYEVPAYSRRMPLWDTIGIFAYSQAVALFESLLVLGFLVFVCISLPRRFFKDKFVSQGTVAFFTTFVFVIPVHYQMRIVEALDWNMGLYQVLVGIWVVFYLVALLGLSLVVRYNRRFEQGIINFVERLVVLSTLYVVVGLLSLLIVIGRNAV